MSPSKVAKSSLNENTENVIFRHNEIFSLFIFLLHFGSRIGRKENRIAHAHIHFLQNAFFIRLSRTYSDNFALARFFLSSFRQDNPTFCHFGRRALNEHAVSKRFNIFCCHDPFLPVLEIKKYTLTSINSKPIFVKESAPFFSRKQLGLP